jgi:multicomponent Na+:H+ antiporter subunit D
MLLGGLGAAAIFWGSLRALVQARLKLIVAYSTVAQLGYLFLVFPLAGGAAAAQPWTAGAWTGAIFQALSHGLAKAAMFLAAGLFMQAAGSDRLGALRGLARVMPMTAFAFALASVTLISLPPSGGFTAKYLLMTSSFAAGQWIWALVHDAGRAADGGLSLPPDGRAFRARGGEGVQAVARARQAVPLVLAGLAILLGVLSAAPFEFLQIGRPEAAEAGP